MISIAGRRPVPAKAILRCLFADEGGLDAPLGSWCCLEGGPLSLHFPLYLILE